jgi:hypothetical protein
MKHGSLIPAVVASVIVVFGVLNPSAAYPEEVESVPEIEIVEDAAVDRMAFCAAVRDRAPIGVADTFPSDIFSIYCFTRIVGVQDTTSVIHSWYYRDAKFSEVELAVRSSSWRTWSRKKMKPEWTGEWRVDIIAPDGGVIASKKFFLE